MKATSVFYSILLLAAFCGMPQQDVNPLFVSLTDLTATNEDWPECLMDDSADTQPDNEQEENMTDMIISKCAEAMGGIEKIESIRTLKVDEVYPDHGNDPRTFEMKRPDMYRNPRGNLVFDGRRACWLKGKDGKSEPELVPQEEWKDFEVDIAYHFPAFFEYPSHYDGSETIEGKETVKLKVTLPLGAVMTYYLDSNTWLISRITAKFTLSGKEFNSYRDFFDYRLNNGLFLPYGFTYGSRTGQLKGWVTSYYINFPFNEKMVKIPKKLIK